MSRQLLEEAHELAPQMSGGRGNTEDGEAAMLGAFKRLWKLGRASGIGGTAITQRPASLSKDITTQSEILIAHRTIGPQDVKAVGEWVKYHGERLDILAELPTLPTGEAFVWAPEFPEGKPIGLQRTSILLRETYDSASTPKVGEQRVEPKELAAVDLERLRAKMAATIEKAKADDPRELRKVIADLRKELASKSSIPQSKENVSIKRVEVLTDADRALLEKLSARLKEQHERSTTLSRSRMDRLRSAIVEAAESTHRTLADLAAVDADSVDAVLNSKGFQKVLAKLSTLSPEPSVQKTQGQFIPPRTNSTALYKNPRTIPAPRAPHEGNGHSQVKGGAFRSMLVALAQAGRPLQDSQLTARAGMALSGTFDKYLGQMRSEGWVIGERSRLEITDAGLVALGSYEPLPTGDALQSYWLSKLGAGKKSEMLGVLIAAYPQSLSDHDVADRASMALSGTFDKYLGQLRSLMLVEGARSALRASAELFE